MGEAVREARRVLQPHLRQARELRGLATHSGSVDESSGQATVEAALAFPIVLISLLLVVQVGLVVRDALALEQAAREGARAAAVSAQDDVARAAVRRSAGPLESGRIEIEITPPSGEAQRGDAVSVRLAYAERMSVPVISRIVSFDLPLRASATMRLERAAPTPTPSP